MAYLVRKFNRAKWEPSAIRPEHINQLTADAFTSCLRTSGNTLSVWHAESPDWGTFDDILAALFSTLDGPNRADVIIFEEEVIENIAGVDLLVTEGGTAADTTVNSKHRDIANLNYESISQLAEVVLSELGKQEPLIKRYNEKKVIELVKNSVDNGRIDPAHLHKRWQVKLGIAS